MEKFETEELRRLMDLRHNIRNISVVSHVDHGKTTLINSLVAAAGHIAQEAAGVETTDPVVPISRFIKTKLTGMSLYYEMDDDCLKSCKEERQGNKYLINLVDCPGHVDFSPEVTTALRITDAALVVVDCVEGVCVQTETVLRHAVGERARPVLTVNKMDRCFLELKVDGEEAYQIFQRVIETANVTVAMYADPLLGDVQFYPEKGTVAFSSGIQGWGFTLTTFARMYALKFGVDESKMMERLWGENFFDTATKKWSNKNTGSSTCKRGFVQFCYEPISDIINSSMNGHNEKLMAMLHKLGVTMKSDTKGLVKWGLMKSVMQTWLPATSAIFEMIISHLPSPVTAQKYRVENLYNGPLDDKYANAIRNCDPEGPLMLYISNMIPSCARGSFFAFGRVFSGKVSTGMKLRIMGPNFVPGQKKDLYIKSVQETLIWMGKTLESVGDVPCGNTVTMLGLDQFITKNATLTNEKESNAHPIVGMKFSVSHVVYAAVQCKDASDLPKLVEGLKLLAKTDPTAVYKVEESGEQTLASAGGLHIDACLEYLQYYMGWPRLRFTDPVVSFRETVFEKSMRSVSPSSANKQNQLFMEARPLEEGLVEAIDVGRVGPKDDPKTRAKVLSEEFGWEKNLAKKIWCFGPETTGPNMFLDKTKGGVQYLNEIKDSVVAGFEWASKEGALAGEKMRGICFELFDATLPHDAIDRGGAQIIPTVRRGIHAAQLLSSPRLMEPIYLVDIQAPEKVLGGIHSVLKEKRGRVLEESQRPGTPLFNIKAYLPVIESDMFTWALRRATSGQASQQCVFDHWEIVPSDPFKTGTKAADYVAKILKRKGLEARMTVSQLEGK